jgi:LacI family transcriptional regulator
LATIKEVAKKAGVSVGTVSNYLTGAVPVSPHLKKRVEKAIRVLNYHPNHIARSLKTQQTRMLGMVISDITNPFFPQMVRGAEDAAIKQGYLLVTFNTDDQPDRQAQVLHVLRYRKFDGILLVVALPRGDVSPIQATVEAGIPIVCLDRIPEGIELDSVTVDNIRGARDCVAHLIERGHRRVATIAGSKGMYITEERLQGYYNALRDAGLQVRRSLVKEGDFRKDKAYNAAMELLRQPDPPTAIFAANSIMAFGVLHAIEDLGLSCPKDIALATFDDLSFGDAFRPHLTCVAQPSYDIGRMGAELLIDRIKGQGQPEPVHLRLDTELRVRESTAGTREAISV